MMKHKADLLIILFFISTIIMIGGCATPTTKEPNNVAGIQGDEKGNTVNERFSESVLGVGDTIDITVYRKKGPEFILGVGDTIDIAVYREKTSEFVLGAGDSLEISVYRHDELTRKTEIDSSGMIMFPLIGDIYAAGKVVTKLRDEIRQRLSKYIVDPQVTIDVSERQNLTIEAISTSFKISAQKAGKINFPIIGEVQASGRHVNDFTNEIQQKLSKYFFKPQVIVNVSQIQDLKIEDLSISTRIGTSGIITLPLIGDVYAKGKGVFKLRDEIQQKLAKYIVEPEVTINVSGIRSQQVSILGEVKSPGTLTLDREISALEAISQSGGFTDDANEEKVLLVRNKTGVARVTALNLNIQGIVQKGKLDQNVYLRNGDIIYVPPSFIANVEKFMMRFYNIINPFVSLERGIILAPEALEVLRGREEEKEIFISP